MRFAYEFSNLCGSVYKQGNVVFTPDGNSVLSPVGNRLTVFDLVHHKSQTLPFETRKNIARLALSPNGHLLIAVDDDGHAVVINFLKRVQLCEFAFKKPVVAMAFSPDSQFVAVTYGSQLQVWRAPPLVTTYRPFVLHRTYTGHYADVLCVEWSDDSQFLVTGSADHTVRLYSLHPIPGFVPPTFTGHSNHVLGVFFGQPTLPDEPRNSTLYSVGKDGSLFVWRFQHKDMIHTVPHRLQQQVPKLEGDTKVKAEGKDDAAADDSDADAKAPAAEAAAAAAAEPKKTHAFHKARQDKRAALAAAVAQDPTAVPYLAAGHFVLHKRHYFNAKDHAKLVSCALHRSPTANLLVAGFSSGVFGLYELPDFNNIHTLSISQKKITTVAVNSTGEWLAFGCASLGQLLVWEWASETYVLKQQGHFFDVNALAYSPDGQLVATGGDDGKVKLWNTASGFCFVTFSEHSAPVNCVEFSTSGTVVLSASLDGTVRAYDLVRYRNFRTLTSPQPTQFTSLAIDPSGEVVVAGSLDPYDIYVWSLQTGRLLDILNGHEAPIAGLSFTPAQSLLASCSWDKSVRLWDVFNTKVAVESFTHSTDVLALAFRPDGKQLCSASLDGALNFWDVSTGTLSHTIDGKKDIAGGRRADDAKMAKNSSHSTAFTSVCYSADGTCVLAGGNSAWVCIYEVSNSILLRKFQISHNQSLDGIRFKLNSRHMTEAGPLELLDDAASGSDVEDRLDHSLPGARTADLSSRTTRLVARTKCVRFSPTGLQWAAASTEGLLMYSLDESLHFDPTDLGLDITPAGIVAAIKARHYARALLMALSLNEKQYIEQALESVPPSAADISLVVRALPPHRVQRVLSVVADKLAASPHLQFYLSWAHTLMAVHGTELRKNSNKLMQTFRALQKSLTTSHGDLAKLCDDNRYLLDYLCTLTPLQANVDAATKQANAQALAQAHAIVAASASTSTSAADAKSAQTAAGAGAGANGNGNGNAKAAKTNGKAAAAAAAAAATAADDSDSDADAAAAANPAAAQLTVTTLHRTAPKRAPKHKPLDVAPVQPAAAAKPAAVVANAKPAAAAAGGKRKASAAPAAADSDADADTTDAAAAPAAATADADSDADADADADVPAAPAKRPAKAAAKPAAAAKPRAAAAAKKAAAAPVPAKKRKLKS